MHQRLTPPLATYRLSRKRQRGISLLESLVAVVVLAIAVLGMLVIQLRTLAETQTGVYRSQAVRAIEDLAERIKSNPAGFAQLSNYVADWETTPATGGPNCVAAACTNEQLATWDLKQWRESVAQKLPNGQANTFLSTDEVAGAQRQLGVMLAWRVNEASDDGDYYLKPFQMDATHLPADISCPAGLICHLVYVQP